MAQFEYNDLNKFFVSIGVFLIGLTFILPWLYLKEKFDLEIKHEDLMKYTENAQIIIKRRQTITSLLTTVVPVISVLSFVVGSYLAIIGIKGWKKIQILLEERELLINRELTLKIVQLSEKEKLQKVSDDIKNQMPINESKTPTTFNIAEKYIEAETQFYQVIKPIFETRFKILKDFRIEKNEYDLVLKSPLQFENDIIFEIKYSESRINGQYFYHSLQQLQNSVNYYQENIKSNALGRLVFLMPYFALNNQSRHPESILSSKSINLIENEDKKLKDSDIRVTYFDIDKMKSYSVHEILDKLKIKIL